MNRVTFVDAGVLIAAVRGTNEVSQRALQILADGERTLATSEFVRLEVLPKAIFYDFRTERNFCEKYFAAVPLWAEPGRIMGPAFQAAARYGLSGFDALHVAAALSVGASELVTTERKNKPLHRVTSLRVISII